MGEIGEQARQRDNQAGEVDFRKDTRVTDQRIGTLCHASLEIIPQHGSAHIEDQMGHTIGRHIGHLAENHREDNGCHQGLDDEP